MPANLAERHGRERRRHVEDGAVRYPARERDVDIELFFGCGALERVGCVTMASTCVSIVRASHSPLGWQ